MRRQKVEDRRDDDGPGGRLQRHDRHNARAGAGALEVEQGGVHPDPALRGVREGQQRVDGGIRNRVFQIQVPAAFLVPAETDAAVGHHEAPGSGVEQHGLPLGVVRGVAQVGRPQEPAGLELTLVFFQHDRKGQVGVGFGVGAEILALTLDVEFLQDHVAHGHGECGICPRLGRQPGVGELDVLGVVRGHGGHPGAAVAGLREEVGVGCPRHGQVGAPDDHVGGFVPVGALRHIGLLAPHLGRCRRQVAVPVVKARQHPADQRQKSCPGGVADHGHGRDRREAEDAVGAVRLDGVDEGGGDQHGRFVPGDPHETAFAAFDLIGFALGLVGDDAAPGGDRVRVGGQCLAPEREQGRAHQRVLQTHRAVGVPGVSGAARAAAGLVVGETAAAGGVVRALGFPDNDPVLDVDVPGTGAGAVDAVGGADFFIVLPALAVEVLPLALAAADFTPSIGNRFFTARLVFAAGAQEPQLGEKTFGGHGHLHGRMVIWKGRCNVKTTFVYDRRRRRRLDLSQKQECRLGWGEIPEGCVPLYAH